MTIGYDGNIGGVNNNFGADWDWNINLPYTGEVDWSAMPYGPGQQPPSPEPPTTATGGNHDGGNDDGGDNGGWGGYPSYDPYAAYDAQRQKNAIAAIKGLLDEYGLSSLYDKIVEYVKEGYDPSTVMILIRTTPEYKQRFPAMETLMKRGRAISEATYIDYERGAASMEQRYGLPKGMLMGNVTKLLESEVSAMELDERVKLAAAGSLQAPQDLKDTLSSYYGIDQGGLTAYFLDPQIAMPLLEKQYATAQIGTEAIRQNVGIDVGIASQLQDLGVTQQEAQVGFGEVSRQRGFTSGFGDVVSKETLIQGNVAKNQSAQAQIERVSRARVGAFEGGGQFVTDQRGNTSLGSSSR